MTFDWSAVRDGFTNPLMLQAAWTTVWLAVAAMCFGLILGSIAALMRVSGNPVLFRIAGFYIWLMRGTPLLVQLIVIYTGFPEIGIRLDVVTSTLLGLSVNEGAYQAEIIRAGIEGVHRGQMEAARALGMTFSTAMRRVILPQAMRLTVPPLGNNFNAMLKATSLASVISMTELLRQTEELVQLNFRVLELYLVAAVYYLIMTTVWGFIQKRIEIYLSRSSTGPRMSHRAPLVAEHA